MKFIRHTYSHKNDRGFGEDIRARLNNSPVFLERFPALVTKCWEKLLPHLQAINMQMEHSALREFFDRIFEVESVLVPGDRDDPAWLKWL